MSGACKYLGGRLSVRETAGKLIEVRQCDQFGKCVASKVDTVFCGIKNCCEECESFIELIQVPKDYDCIHRGKETDEKLNCSCGGDRTIYGCDIKGKCCKRLPVGWSVDKLAELHPGVAVCRGCGSAE